MLLNFIDEVLAGVEKYTIIHSDNSSEEVSIQLATAVTTQGTPLNKALFDKIDKYLCPVGMITLWSGAINNIPTGWALCNGQNGTPDLTDKFIVGAGSGYSVGATGGEASHTLTTDELPAHNHGLYLYSGSGNQNPQRSITYASQTHVQRGTYTDLIANAGSGSAHENRPPYYALAYIMKLAN